jgi:hypothetical protein
MNTFLKLGQEGPDIEALTRLLVERGFLATVSSRFDARVKTAVMGFQSQNLDERGLPLKVDGIVGPVTWWALTHPRVNVVPPGRLVRRLRELVLRPASGRLPLWLHLGRSRCAPALPLQGLGL